MVRSISRHPTDSELRSSHVLNLFLKHARRNGTCPPYCLSGHRAKVITSPKNTTGRNSLLPSREAVSCAATQLPSILWPHSHEPSTCPYHEPIKMLWKSASRPPFSSFTKLLPGWQPLLNSSLSLYRSLMFLVLVFVASSLILSFRYSFFLFLKCLLTSRLRVCRPGAPFLTREQVYNCWGSPTQLFSGPSSEGLMTIFYCFKFEGTATWSARSLYLHPPGIGWARR
jgi:hypothetical protein